MSNHTMARPLVWAYTDEATGRMYDYAEHYRANFIDVVGKDGGGNAIRHMPLAYEIFPKRPTIAQQNRGMTSDRYQVSFNRCAIGFLENADLDAAKALAQSHADNIISAIISVGSEPEA